jgi:hypothetical protein
LLGFVGKGILGVSVRNGDGEAVSFSWNEMLPCCLMSCINVFLGLFWYHRRSGHAVNAIAMEFLNRNIIGLLGYDWICRLPLIWEKNSSSEVALQALVV